MKERIGQLLEKYHSVENLLKVASQAEKEEFFLNRLQLEESYNENPLSSQHSMNLFLKLNLPTGALRRPFRFGDKHFELSVFSDVLFEGKSQLFYPEHKTIYSSIKIKFSSIIQFFDFHSAMLFWDRKTAKKILNTKNYSNNRASVSLSRSADDRMLLRRYRIKIMSEAAKSAIVSSNAFSLTLKATGSAPLIYESELEFWGGGEDFMIENYWGKILTKIKLES